jgi:hypothetical protein
VLDFDPYSLSGLEACLYEPLAGDAQQRKERAVLPLTLAFGRGPAAAVKRGGLRMVRDTVQIKMG